MTIILCLQIFFREEEGAWYSCLIPKSRGFLQHFSGNFRPRDGWAHLKGHLSAIPGSPHFCTNSLMFLSLFLFKGGKYLVVDVGLPMYDVVTDCIAAYLHYQWVIYIIIYTFYFFDIHLIFIIDKALSFSYVVVHLFPSWLVWGRNQVCCACCPSKSPIKHI